MRRDSSRPVLSHRRIVGERTGQPKRTGSGDRAGGLVGMAFLLLIGVVFAIMLSDGQVADNLGAALRHWSGERD